MIRTAIFSILGACFYRMGGTYLGTKYRDWGIPTIMLWYFILSGVEHWTLVLSWGIMFGAQTTYNKWAHKFFLKDPSNDVKWIDWLFTGLAYSVALLPLSLYIGNIGGFLIRGLVVTLFTLLWSEFIGKAWLEESGRGLIQIITLPLLLQ